jgi:hypothetical protein
MMSSSIGFWFCWLIKRFSGSSTPSFILQEDGSFILQEDGSKILQE